MNNFQYWYVYYDSIFLKAPIQPTKVMLQTFSYEQTIRQKWPTQIKPVQIGECFELLENFILKNDNWKIADLSEQITKQLQTQINNFLIMLLNEKRYAIEYWPKSKRRIQASFCHLFIFIQQFALAMIPNSKQSLYQCRNSQILCTNIIYVEKLINELIKRFSGLHKFMINSNFKEQKNLTIDLIDNFGQLFRNLPNLKPKQLSKVPKLLLYVYYQNPIQISKMNYKIDKTQMKLRKKSNTFNTIRDSIQKTSISQLTLRYRKIHQFNGYYYKVQKNSNSCVDKILNYALNIKQAYVKIQCPQKFSFPKLDRKKHTMTTLFPQSSRQRMISNNSNLNYSQTTINQQSPSKRRTEKSINSSEVSEKRKKQRSTQRTHIHKLVDIDQENQRNRSISKLVLKSKQKLQKNNQKLTYFNNLVAINTGSGKGWKILKHHYLNQKSISNKLFKLINESD